MRMSLAATLEMAFPGSIAASRAKILRFEEILKTRGILPALGFLNARVKHRFTSVSRFDTPLVRNLFVFDRRSPDILFGGTVQVLEETYGAIVQRRKQPFRTDYSLRDSRLAFNASRATVLSYLGVPIKLPTGEMWGVLSHHDPEVRAAPIGEIELLEKVVPALVRWL